MKYLSYLVWIFILVLSLFFYNEYLIQHIYYYNFLKNSWNWSLLFFALLASLLPALYILFKSNKTWKWIILSFLLGFALFSLIIWIYDGWFINLWYFIYLLNFLILFVFFVTIVIWTTGIWDIILHKIKFNESIYDFSIKTWLWISVLSIIIYYLNILWFISIIPAYIILALLIWIIFLRKNSLKNIFFSLLKSLKEFNQNIKNTNPYLIYIFLFIFTLIFFYIYIWFTYSFIPYPSAWDANHAYMFIPKVLAEYWGYPWQTNFRPEFNIWTGILAWIYNIWFFTWFSQDTWMITFNFTSWIFSLFFGFMLITTIIKIVYDKKNLKHYILLILAYILILTWLFSWMGAFLVFVDNKTDLAVFMFVLLWLFLAVYSLFNQEWNNINIQNNKSNEIYIFFALSWFFFGIANIIKPTASFDFFETAIVFSVLNIWVLAVIWWLLFVVWILYYLKFRWFDKLFIWLNENVKNFLSSWSIISWFLVWLLSLALKIIKNKTKVFSFFIFIFSFILTLLITKSSFWLGQYIYDKNIDFNVWKFAISYIMWNSLPTITKDQFTWALYSWLNTWNWSAYNEDNGRYVWYGNKDFDNPWWSFIIPSFFKKDYIIYFDKNEYEKSNYKNKLYAFSPSKINPNIMSTYVIKIFNNKDEKIYKKEIQTTISDAENKWELLNLATKLWLNLNWNTPSWEIRNKVYKQLEENTKKWLLTQIKEKFFSWNLNLKNYSQVLQTKDNEELFNDFKNKKENYTIISIPYNYLIPFNVIFNWSLQNESSYYTDIGVVWLLLFIISIFAFFYSFIVKDKLLWAFSFATLIGWIIWYGIASWIVWYNIWWIIWLIITTILFVNRLKDKLFLAYILIFISIVWIFLNLFRIITQWWWEVQLWYRSSIWKLNDYVLTSWSLNSETKIKIPYTADNIFSLQFNFYKKAINYFNKRKYDEAWIIWWTYMKYFVKNQNKIIDDQFLIYLYKLFSDDNVDKAYQRLKDQKITWIVIDPNIASVVMWEWNKSLWYRYYWYTDEKNNVTTKWVLPMFVDLAQSWNIQYVYSNNLWIKYSLTISDDNIKKAIWTWISEKDILQLRYKLTSIKFLSRMTSMEDYQTSINIFYQLLLYRAINEPFQFIEDIADVNWLNIESWKKIIENINNFNSFTNDEKTAILIFNSIRMQLNQNSWNTQQILRQLIEEWIWWRAQLLFVKVE